MAQAQTTKASNRSEGARKAAATRAANKAAAQPQGTTVGPKGAPLAQTGEDHQVTEDQRKGERRQQQDNAVAQFSASQMTTPAAHEVHELSEEDRKRIAFEEQVKLLAADFGVDPNTVLPTAAPQAGQPATQRPAKQVQNNVTRPGADTVTGKIWNLADKLSAENKGNPVPIATLRAHPEMREVNDNTLKTQFARWRSYHGIKGRIDVVQPEQPEMPPEAEQALQQYTGPDRRAS